MIAMTLWLWCYLAPGALILIGLVWFAIGRWVFGLASG